MALNKIGQIAIPVKDIARAVEFYKETLGLKFLFQSGDLAFFDADGIMLMLEVPTSEEFDHPASIIYFQVVDIMATYQTMAASGVSFRDQPHKVADLGQQALWMTFFSDTEGNTLALRSLVPQEPNES